ncbi:MAG: 50S ribosomal protein L11 methyltransferase [Solirubrobacteraceae bacterium]
MIRLALRVEREHAELVLAELVELVPAGVEERDDGGEVVEYAIYGAPGELPQLPDLRAAAGGAFVEVRTSELPDGWEERWKQFHRPVLIERERAEDPRDGGPSGLYVHTPWQPPSERAGVEGIVIEPARAFGTGAHETTRLTLTLLLELAAAGARGSLLDLGTGSGVLAIAAGKLGFAPIVAIDSERESVEAANGNAAANGVAIAVRRQDLRAQPPELSGVEVVLANLVAPLLLELATTMRASPEHLLIGGLLRGEADEVVDAFERRLALREQRRLEAGDWAGVWLSAAL